MDKPKLNLGRLATTIIIGVAMIFCADGFRRIMTDEFEGTIVINGKFKNNITATDNFATLTSENDTMVSDNGTIEYLGYTKVEIPAENIYTGSLTVINDEHEAKGIFMSMTSLAEVKNEYYTLRNDDMIFNIEASAALNSMMEAYNAETGKSNFVVYNTTETYNEEDAVYTAEYPEALSGYSLDLAILSKSGNFIEYDGLDTESWIIENCHNYGFIVRYESDKTEITGNKASVYHLRYVGKVHSAIMNEKDLCLEEYLDFLRPYMIDTQKFNYTLDGCEYEIYYTSASIDGSVTGVRVPVSGNYTISGNNYDGFIVTAKK